MVQAMLAGVASIKAQQTRMNVIGNNLANINTTAYKSGKVTFQDMMSQTLRGATRPGGNLGGHNAIQYGMGVLISGTDTNNEQGSLQSTNRPTDLALQGNGFLVLSDGEKINYTRDGAIDLDANGDLVHRATGQRLTGWTADPASGTIDTSQPINEATTLNIPLGLRTSVQKTTTIGWAGNLNAGASLGAEVSSPISIYDSLGTKHEVNITFTKAGENQWTWTVGPVAGTSTVTGTGTLNFDGDGNLSAGSTGQIVVDPVGSAPNLTIDMNMSGMTQLTQANQTILGKQNGFPPGSLTDYTIGNDGVITGIFNNGLTRPLGQIAVAIFANAGGLERQGSNLFRATDNSGDPSIGQPLQGGRGLLSSGFLEQSNVDIGQEFTDLIITQRGFQANTRVVTTVDEMLQELINMKR